MGADFCSLLISRNSLYRGSLYYRGLSILILLYYYIALKLLKKSTFFLCYLHLIFNLFSEPNLPELTELLHIPLHNLYKKD